MPKRTSKILREELQVLKEDFKLLKARKQAQSFLHVVVFVDDSTLLSSGIELSVTREAVGETFASRYKVGGRPWEHREFVTASKRRAILDDRRLTSFIAEEMAAIFLSKLLECDNERPETPHQPPVGYV